MICRHCRLKFYSGKLVGLLHRHPHLYSSTSLRVDGGANCHVLNNIHLFMLFYKKEIDCTLACGEKTRFQGVGIAVVEIAPELYVVLAPCYLAAQDDVCTISTGALKQ